MIKHLFASTMVLFVCLALGACTSFSNTVSDNWPTWLGGMPKDVPPRPGAPGYEEFLVHQQGKDTTATTAAAPAQPAQAAGAQTPPAAAPGQAAAPQAPRAVTPGQSAGAPAPPAINRSPGDQAAVQGGLY